LMLVNKERVAPCHVDSVVSGRSPTADAQLRRTHEPGLPDGVVTQDLAAHAAPACDSGGISRTCESMEPSRVSRLIISGSKGRVIASALPIGSSLWDSSGILEEAEVGAVHSQCCSARNLRS
jgi:hypothetical protein